MSWIPHSARYYRRLKIPLHPNTPQFTLENDRIRALARDLQFHRDPVGQPTCRGAALSTDGHLSSAIHGYYEATPDRQVKSRALGVVLTSSINGPGGQGQYMYTVIIGLRTSRLVSLSCRTQRFVRLLDPLLFRQILIIHSRRRTFLVRFVRS